MNKKNQFNDASAETLCKFFIHGLAQIDVQNEPYKAKLNEELCASLGIKLPFKLYHLYKLPNDMIPREILIMLGLQNVTTEQLEQELLLLNEQKTTIQERTTGAIIDHTKEISTNKGIIEFIKNFTPEQLKLIAQHLPTYTKKWSVDKLIDEIQRLNPELGKIKLKDKDGKYVKSSFMPNAPDDFLRGVAWGYSPEDINFAITTTTEDMAEYCDSPRVQSIKYLMSPIPAPSRLDALVAAEQQIQQIENARKTNGLEL